MGFTKNGCGMKMLKTWRTKEMLIEMDEGELRSLEKCFMWEEMMKWRRKIKGKKEMNSDNGGGEVKKDEAKGQKESNKEKFWPPHLRLSQPLKKKKKKKFFFKVFKYPKSQIFNLKIFILKFSSSYSQCPSFKFKPPVFKEKNSNPRFLDQNFKS